MLTLGVSEQGALTQWGRGVHSHTTGVRTGGPDAVERGSTPAAASHLACSTSQM